MKITDLPLDARPREKACVFGLSTLSNEELLAILIQSGYKDKSALDIANDLLKDYPSLQDLCNLSIEELVAYKGIKQAGALKIATAFQLAKRLSDELFIDSSSSGLEPSDIKKKYSLEMLHAESEQVILVLMNRKGKLIKEKHLSSGNKSFAEIDLKLFLKAILSTTCHSFYILHNHPAKDCLPSDADISLTFKIISECAKYDVHLKDHLVFGRNGVYSMGKSKLI